MPDQGVLDTSAYFHLPKRGLDEYVDVPFDTVPVGTAAIIQKVVAGHLRRLIE